MTEQVEVLNWEDRTENTSWDLYLRACVDYGTFGVGYKIEGENLGKSTIAINFNEFGRRPINEYVTIVDGEIKYFNHRVRRDDGLENFYLKTPKPLFIAGNLERIIETVPDEMARKLLGNVSEEEWDKIKPEHDGMFNYLKRLKGYTNPTNVA